MNPMDGPSAPPKQRRKRTQPRRLRECEDCSESKIIFAQGLCFPCYLKQYETGELGQDLCECGVNKATAWITVIIQEREHRYHVCRACAEIEAEIQAMD